MRVYEIVAESMVKAGLGRVFGVMGDANMRYLSTYIDSVPGSYVATAHEASAVSMADGYSRLSGEVGVASVTHGPGLTNALTALTNAVRANSRLLILTGSTPSQRGNIQASDLRATAAVAGADYCRVFRPETVVEDFTAALRATSLSQRPVVLDVPVDLLAEEVDPRQSPVGFGPWTAGRSVPDDDTLDGAIGAIASASRPVILAGRGAVISQAREEIGALAELLHAPVATTILGRSYLDGIPRNIGIFGSQSHSLAIRVISQSDCIVVLGAGLNNHTTANGDLLRDKTVVRCDLWPNVGGDTPVTLSMTGDVKVFASAVVEGIRQVGPRPESSWARQVEADLDAFDPASDYIDHTDDSALDLRTAMRVLDRVLPEDRALITDHGHFVTAPWRYLSCAPGAFSYSGSFGAIGLGLGVATGAAFANRDRLTVAVVGDGGLMMSIQELTVLVQHGLPLLLAVANDNAYGSEYHKLNEYGHDPDHSKFAWPSLAGIARSFGADGEVVTSIPELDALEPRLRRLAGPLLLDIRIDPSRDSRNYR